MAKKTYLAIDLGAESGRVMAGVWNGKRLELDEVHRFPNGPVLIGGSMRWDVLRLWAEIQQGLGLAARKYGKSIVSVGADTWGVDFVLLNQEGEMLGQPFHYRDVRTNGWMDRAFRRVPRAKIFAETGLQFMQINTLYQLLALKSRSPALLEQADCLLLMPDFIHWCLSGSRVAEFTNGTTTQCMSAVHRTWAVGMLKKLGLPTHIFPRIVPPGSLLASLREQVAEQTGLGKINVVAPPTHDTASAVAGVPTTQTGKTNWAYLSSGTWSLMGLEVPNAVLTKRASELNITNEGGVDGTYRLLKNIMGLWLVQQCRRSFEAKGKKLEYAELAQLATKAKPLRSLVSPNDPRFLSPADMPKAIQSFCSETRQAQPRTEGELARTAYESLALKYRQVLGWLEDLGGTRIEAIHIVGGGSRNKLLNQFTADACQRPVLAGPVEATAMGNLLVQIRTDGELATLSDMRAVVRASTPLETYEPRNGAAWDEAWERFEGLSHGN